MDTVRSVLASPPRIPRIPCYFSRVSRGSISPSHRRPSGTSRKATVTCSCNECTPIIEIYLKYPQSISLPFVMPTSDRRGAGGSRVTTDIVVDGLPQPSRADRIVTAQLLHLGVKQEEVDWKSNIVIVTRTLPRSRSSDTIIVRSVSVKRKHCCMSASKQYRNFIQSKVCGKSFYRRWPIN